MNKLKNLLKETPEAYYWAGFLMADGYIHHQRKSIKLTLSKRDSDHLIKFAKFVGSNVNKGKSFLNGKVFENITVSYQDKSSGYIDLLINKFHFKERKSYNPPIELKIKKDDFFISFFIGYLDGDATIGGINNNNLNQIKVACHRSWKDILEKWFLRIWKISGCKKNNNIIKIPKSKNLDVGKFKACRINVSNYDFVIFLKNKAIKLKLPYLDRKWSRIVNPKRTYSNNKKEIILKMLKNGLSCNEINKKFNYDHYVYDVKHKYIDHRKKYQKKWSSFRGKNNHKL